MLMRMMMIKLWNFASDNGQRLLTHSESIITWRVPAPPPPSLEPSFPKWSRKINTHTQSGKLSSIFLHQLPCPSPLAQFNRSTKSARVFGQTWFSPFCCCCSRPKSKIVNKQSCLRKVVLTKDGRGQQGNAGHDRNLNPLFLLFIIYGNLNNVSRLPLVTGQWSTAPTTTDEWRQMNLISLQLETATTKKKKKKATLIFNEIFIKITFCSPLFSALPLLKLKFSIVIIRCLLRQFAVASWSIECAWKKKKGTRNNKIWPKLLQLNPGNGWCGSLGRFGFSKLILLFPSLHGTKGETWKEVGRARKDLFSLHSIWMCSPFNGHTPRTSKQGTFVSLWSRSLNLKLNFCFSSSLHPLEGEENPLSVGRWS